MGKGIGPGHPRGTQRYLKGIHEVGRTDENGKKSKEPEDQKTHASSWTQPTDPSLTTGTRGCAHAKNKGGLVSDSIVAPGENSGVL
mmetsp:Transcript_7162/g.25392  ORF Transcript_7162/g.25392 Transcript_7162/m.25392 type:complete len:86 (+) Transcript_7162:33-290(+)